MRLEQIARALDREGLLVSAPDVSRDVTGVTDDSRRVTAGALFCAVEGTGTDGHRFLDDAMSRGAAAALVSSPRDTGLPLLVVRDGRAATAVAAAEWYGRPGDRLVLVGVTGTNGKSTTVALIRHLLNREATAASLGTLGALDGEGRAVPDVSNLTTPGPVELQAVLAELVRRGVTHVAMETSSHALHQRRVAGLSFATGVYTNLTHEHLDYHGDLEGYRAAKMLLSEQITPGGAEVVNQDDPAWRALPVRPHVRRIRFGLNPDSDVLGMSVIPGAEGSRLVIRFGDIDTEVELPLLGEFNVSNALAAAAAAWSLGTGPREIAEGLRNAPQIPGRMERLASDGYLVLRDYAHTPDAYERVLSTLRPLTSGRLIILFGCGGNRDRGKRAVMGRIAAARADLVVITSDNPRSEDPESILDDIEAGMSGAHHLRITDRREAIEQALALLRPGDCLLLAGKGHETYQIVGTEKQPFDERSIVLSALGQAA